MTTTFFVVVVCVAVVVVVIILLLLLLSSSSLSWIRQYLAITQQHNLSTAASSSSGARVKDYPAFSRYLLRP